MHMKTHIPVRTDKDGNFHTHDKHTPFYQARTHTTTRPHLEPKNQPNKLPPPLSLPSPPITPGLMYTPGEVCVCGVPRRGIPSITSVSCPPGTEGATVIEVPLDSLRRGKLFTPPALDAFLRVLNVGSAGDSAHDAEREGTAEGGTPGRGRAGGDDITPRR